MVRVFAMRHMVWIAVLALGCGGGHKGKGNKLGPGGSGLAGPVRPLETWSVEPMRGPYKTLAEACEALRGEQAPEDYQCAAAEAETIKGDKRAPEGSALRAVTVIVASDPEPTRYCGVVLETAAGLWVVRDQKALCADQEFRALDRVQWVWADIGGGAGAELVLELETTVRMRDEVDPNDEGPTLIDGKETVLIACGAGAGNGAGDVPGCVPAMVIGCTQVGCFNGGDFDLDWKVDAAAHTLTLSGTGRLNSETQRLLGPRKLP